jgi:aldehyde:ferredoxin oxidoreductase
VDLSRGRIRKELFSEGLVKQFLGGKGIGTFLLYSEIERGSNPLGPENKLILATGPATGTILPHKGHITCYKSPLTGIYASSSSGGFFADELKRAGYDVLVVEGRAEKPVYLWINDDDVSIKDAGPIWGCDTFQTNEAIRKDLGDYEIRVARIGVAGERLVKFASILNDYSRIAGRCGGGAVMGSKNLKAIAVKGTGAVEVEKIDELIEYVRRFLEKVKNDPATGKRYPIWGTPSLIGPANQLGVFPSKYWHKGTLKGFEKITAEAVRSIKVKDIACQSCPVNCSKIVRVKEGPYAGTVLEGIDYETSYALGGLPEINNLGAIVKAQELCDKLGMDAMTAGNVVAFAMECYEKKLVNSKDTDGIELVWGSQEALIQTIGKIGERIGFGDILAEGVREAAKRIGKGAEALAVHIKGLEPGGFDPRGLVGVALALAVADRGGCHLTATFHGLEMNGPLDRLSYDGKVAYLKDLEDRYNVCDSMVFCRFLDRTLYPWNTLVEVIPLIIGSELKEIELRSIGERITNLTRLFNVREGIRRKDDYWPERFYRETLPDGSATGLVLNKVKFGNMLDEYYESRGWSEDGIPRKETLERLGLEPLVSDLPLS